MRQPRRPGRLLLLLLGLIVGPLLSCPELRDDFALLRDDFALDDASPPPNVMLILVDTLRQDHLSLYGYARNTSPRIDALGASGVVFENHLSHASQTVPSIVSIMLSQLPAEHGFVHRRATWFSVHPPHYRPDLIFVPEVFRAAGYRTGAFIANPFLKARRGFDQGFDQFVYEEGDGSVLIEQASGWIARQVEQDKAPFFAYIHLMDVHNPYEPPDEYRDLYPGPPGSKLVYSNGPAEDTRGDDLQHTIGLYDAQIHHVDRLVGALLDSLEAANVMEKTLVVFTSDHGDEFLEHGGMGHGTHVYGELVRVPLILALPGRIAAGRRVSHLTQHIDLAPTLLTIAGIDRPETFRGDSLFTAADAVYSENGSWRAVTTAQGKLVLDIAHGTREVFAVDDGLDQIPLYDSDLETRLWLQLDTYLERRPHRAGDSTSSSPDWSQEELEHLRALGYLEE